MVIKLNNYHDTNEVGNTNHEVLTMFKLWKEEKDFRRPKSKWPIRTRWVIEESLKDQPSRAHVPITLKPCLLILAQINKTIATGSM